MVPAAMDRISAKNVPAGANPETRMNWPTTQPFAARPFAESVITQVLGVPGVFTTARVVTGPSAVPVVIQVE